MSSPQTSHFALRASGEAPAAHGESCKTKPISGSPTGTGGQNVGNKAKLGRIGISGRRMVMVCAATPPESGMCKTNPPSRGDGWDGTSGTRGERAKQTQFAHRPRPPGGKMRKTNPISESGPAGAGGWLCKQTQLPAMCRSGDRRSREPSVQNKANLSIADCGFPGRHRATGVRLQRSCRIADWRHTSGGAANCAKRTQFGAARPACGRRSVQTKPIWRAKCAKRTQFAPGRADGVAAGANRAKRTQFRGGWPPGGYPAFHYSSPTKTIGP
jgi:hypothetical protein